MSCESLTAAELRRAGYRLTPQRLMILSVLRHGKRHMTAAEILDQVKETYPFVDVSTVYRTVSVLKRMRLVTETDLGTGDYSYEWLESRRHHHLICRNCDAVTSVDHAPVESLDLALQKEFGFHGDLDHFAIFGICKDCHARGVVLPTGPIEPALEER